MKSECVLHVYWIAFGFGYVPQIEKIVLNCGMGDASQNSKGLEATIKNMSLISAQRPVKTKARQAIASFKLREGHHGYT